MQLPHRTVVGLENLMLQSRILESEMSLESKTYIMLHMRKLCRSR